MMARFAMRHLARLLLIVLAAGLFGSTVVRLAPAFGVTEAELDPRLSGESIEALRAEGGGTGGTFAFYSGYLRGIATGDFGFSPSLNRPVAELLRERLPVSLLSLACGVAIGFGCGVVFAMLAVTFDVPLMRAAPVAASAVMIAIPSAALALLFLVAGWPGPLALAAVVFPRTYRYSFAALSRWSAAPHIVAARARGLPPWRILTFHTVPLAGPQLLAIMGMAIGVAFPALVPIEAVCDSPGIGQLAWKAALARDLPVLVSLTMVAAVVISIGNAAADMSADAVRRQA
jgi:peptide/nickel transport system permease protein